MTQAQHIDRAARRQAERRRHLRIRGAARAVAIVAAAAAIWQVAGYIAEGAARGTAQAAPVQLGQGAACVTVDTGRNRATLGARTYRYSDTGSGIRWQVGTPLQARALALAGIDARRAAEPVGRPSIIRTCSTWQDGAA